MSSTQTGRELFAVGFRRAVDRMMRFIDERPTLTVVFVFVFSFALAALRTYGLGQPVPRVHDEFSYLLGADTFRSGRLTNPPHALASHFETFHVLQRPTYASKYPPAQALVLAMGWIIGGRAIVGVWLGFAAMSAALCWMLNAWIGRRWALGASIAVTCWLALTYWSHSYWGGAVAAAGGALTYGAIARLIQNPRASASLALGAGLAILANSRPLEGLVASLPVLFAVARLLVGGVGPPAIRVRLFRVVLPLGLLGVTTLGAMAVYNRAVTGSATTMPHLVYEREKELVPLFVWERRTTRTLTDPRQAAFQAWALAQDADQRGAFAATVAGILKIAMALRFLLPLALVYPLLLVPSTRRASPMGIAAAGTGLVFLGLSVSTWFQPHYVAPIVAPFAALYFGSLRRLSEITPRFAEIGRDVAAATLALWIVPPIVLICAQLPGLPWHHPVADWAIARAHLADSLARSGGNHVLLVRYPPSYSPHDEWVYNGASVDKQSVIWARDLGPAGNQDLMTYYSSRTIWLVDLIPDSTRFYRLERYGIDPRNGASGGAASTRFSVTSKYSSRSTDR